MKRTLNKIISMMLATVVLMGTLSITAWADNNPAQMMANGETWVDENGQTWMPAPEETGMEICQTGTTKNYTWSIPAKTTFYTRFIWYFEENDAMRITAMAQQNVVFATGVKSYNSGRYRILMKKSGEHTAKIWANDIYAFYIENLEEETLDIASIAKPIFNS